MLPVLCVDHVLQGDSLYAQCMAQTALYLLVAVLIVVAAHLIEEG
jgi:hypothetical protein